LIERKSVDDVAGSLNDGRWERQQRNMRKAQYVLGNGEQRKCQICYIIEGEAAKRLVHGGVVARTSWDIVSIYERSCVYSITL
jgi:ERCC4-type nuclease